MSVNGDGVRQRKTVVVNASGDEDLPAFTPPPFTIKELLAAIPAHCFERSAIRSSAYLALDLAMVLALGCAATFIDSTLTGVSKWLAWSAYWFVQGMVCTGIWVIAHECKCHVCARFRPFASH
jgi:omega-6 fatty acid desaturase / acyl-lipid omega-6 desaturase (Delta-12 desaturase)